MIEVLILCEGNNDVNFIKGLVPNSHGDVKFLSGPNNLDRTIRSGYFRKIVCGVGGKGQLPKRAKYLISTMRSVKGRIKIIYVKDKVEGNHVMNNLLDEINEFVSSKDKFTQQKPDVSEKDPDEIIVSFKNLTLTYHVIGVDHSLEDNIWNKIKENNRDAIEIDRTSDNVHEKIRKYSEMKKMELNEFFKGSVDLFDDEVEWFRRLKEQIDS